MAITISRPASRTGSVASSSSSASLKSGQSSPSSTTTNTIAITPLPREFFHPLILEALRDHFATYGEINQWVPLPGFGRILVVYVEEDAAEAAKRHSDPIVIDASEDREETTLRVYRADANPLISRDPFAVSASAAIPTANYLAPPPIEKNFLISPPGSPPVGWEPIKEDPPNAAPLADDLIAALKKLQAHERHRESEDKEALEVLLHPAEGESGVGVYVQDCDVVAEENIDEEQWIYGEPSPARNRWVPIPTALPPIHAAA